MKKYMGRLLALVMCLSMAACGSSGRKWSDTDVIDDYGTVTRNGKQIDVCVTHDQKTIYFYYDDEDHMAGLIGKTKKPKHGLLRPKIKLFLICMIGRESLC